MYKRSKYGNRKTTIHGIKFDSQREADRYQELIILMGCGAITELELQPKLWLQCGGKDVKSKKGRRMYYKADFRYVENGEIIYEDVKGMMTRLSALKIAMVEAEYGIEIKIVR